MTREREEFVGRLVRELPNVNLNEVIDLARKLCRLSKRHARLQEAQCNGDWPADNGERATEQCPRCEAYWAAGTVKTNGCPDCRCEDSIGKALAPYNIVPVFQGDPRGCTAKLRMPSGTTNDVAQEAVCVPQ